MIIYHKRIHDMMKLSLKKGVLKGLETEYIEQKNEKDVRK